MEAEPADRLPSAHDDSGVTKLFVVQRALAVRAELPGAFGAISTYEPLPASGDAAARVVAFARGGSVVSVAPRLTLGLPDMQKTSLTLPPGSWSDRLAGGTHTGEVGLERLWRDFPVCLLTKDDA